MRLTLYAVYQKQNFYNKTHFKSMKKFIVIAALLLGSAPMYATEQRTNEGSTLLAQYNNEQIVRAYYPSNSQLASIKIKIR